SRLVEHRIKKVAGGVSGKWPTSAVGAVSTGGQAKNDDPSTRIAEARNRLPPVIPFPISAAFFARDLLAVGHQAWTTHARDQFTIELFEPRGKPHRRWAQIVPIGREWPGHTNTGTIVRL